MGGRGAASGTYRRNKKVHTYGDEYSTVFQYRNIKFVRVNDGSATAPMETMTQGRVYVTVNANDEIKSITYYSSGSRYKQIDIDHEHVVDGQKEKPHTHIGYVHAEGGTRKPNKREQRMIDRVIGIWQNRNR